MEPQSGWAPPAPEEAVGVRLPSRPPPRGRSPPLLSRGGIWGGDEPPPVPFPGGDHSARYEWCEYCGVQGEGRDVGCPMCHR
eukprot:3837252-Pyramimonas_sp.AAC.1